MVPVLKYAVKRLLLILPIVLGVIFIVFVIMNLTPGNPGRQILGTAANQQQVDQLNHELGFDKPFFTRFVNYVWDLCRGDLGTSYRTRNSFAAELMSRLPKTLSIGLPAILLSSLIGVSLGILSAVKQYSAADIFFTVAAIAFASIPVFFLGMVLIFQFALRIPIFPSFGVANLSGYVLPIITLTAANSAAILRLTRTTMLEAIRQDYIRTAVAKGCSRRRVTWKHALKNAILPVITVMGINTGAIIGGTVIVETVFAIQGMGTYILAAIRAKDIPVVMSSTVLLSLNFCAIMILVDILYALIDPRIRERVTR